MQQVATAIMEDTQDLLGDLHRVTLRLSLRYRMCMFTPDSHDLGVGLRNVAERLRTRFLQEIFLAGPIAPGRYRVSIDLPWRLAGKRLLLQ